MGRLVMWNLLTLDGRFEGAKPWELDWHELVWGDELERLSIEQLGEAAGLVFGRRTYEGMAAYWTPATGQIADLMNGIPKYVFSRTLDRAGWSNTTLVGGDAVDGVRAVKERADGDLFVFGSAALSGALMRQGLFDEYRLALTPVVLGAGAPLFKPDAGRLRLRLLEARPLSTGCVVLRYEPVPEA